MCDRRSETRKSINFHGASKTGDFRFPLDKSSPFPAGPEPLRARRVRGPGALPGSARHAGAPPGVAAPDGAGREVGGPPQGARGALPVGGGGGGGVGPVRPGGGELPPSDGVAGGAAAGTQFKRIEINIVG